MKGATHPCLRERDITELAESMKVLADPNRLRILCLLLKGEKCVCEVERAMGISQQLASHHLNVLKEAGFLRSRREGSSMYYSIEQAKLDTLTKTIQRYFTVPKCSRTIEKKGACRANEKSVSTVTKSKVSAVERRIVEERPLTASRGRRGK